MGLLKSCMDPNSHISLEAAIENYCTSKRAIIDDVTGSAWEFEQLEKIIRLRYRENLFTILTTNLNIMFDPKHPEKQFIPERIISRFSDSEKGRLVLNRGEDYRPGKGKD